MRIRREPEEEDPLRPMDPPPREPPCIWAEEDTTSAAAHTAAMAHWCRIQRIIALPRGCGFVKSLPNRLRCHPERAVARNGRENSISPVSG